jgi:ribosomal protein L15
MRIPKLRGFTNRFKVYYEVVNVGSIAAAAERGAFESGDLPGAPKGKKAAPLTVNQDVLRAVGLVRTMTKPLKILGAGELDVPLFVVADAFTKSAREKIEAAGGTVSVLETPPSATKALGLDGADGVEGEARPARVARTAAGRHAASQKADARTAREEASAEREQEEAAASAAKAAKPPKARKASAEAVAEPAEADDAAAEPAEQTPSDEAAAEPAVDAEGGADAPAETAEEETTADADENA